MNEHLSLVAAEADASGLRVTAVLETDRGCGVPLGGLAVVERRDPPLAGRAFATVRWAIEGRRAKFYSGHYDLTRDDALADLAERAGVLRPARR